MALVTVASLAAALMATGPAAPVRTAAQACLPPIITCPTPKPTQHTPTPTQSHTATPRPSGGGGGGGGGHTPAPSYYPYNPPTYVPPPGTPPPTQPPPSPGAPPEPPPLEVQTIELAVASAAASHPGDAVLVQATLEAQRDADTYSVPGATISFSITSSAGDDASVDPATATSSDTGIVVVTVQTGSQPGDTVVHAQSGNASADITVHADPASTPTPKPKPKHASAPPAGTSGSGSSTGRRLLVGGLAALLAAMAASYAMVLVMGRLRMPNPLARRRVWGRRLR